jgi:membrane-associated protease RseP (regulator of RpoE activity)
LDGGRLLSVYIQTLFRLPPEKYYMVEWYVNMVVFVLMMVLGIVIMIKDVMMIWG